MKTKKSIVKNTSAAKQLTTAGIFASIVGGTTALYSGAMQAAQGSVTFIVTNATQTISDIAESCKLNVVTIPDGVKNFISQCGTVVVESVQNPEIINPDPYNPSVISDALACIKDAACPTTFTTAGIISISAIGVGCCLLFCTAAGAVLYCKYSKNSKDNKSTDQEMESLLEKPAP